MTNSTEGCPPGRGEGGRPQICQEYNHTIRGGSFEDGGDQAGVNGSDCAIWKRHLCLLIRNGKRDDRLIVSKSFRPIPEWHP